MEKQDASPEEETWEDAPLKELQKLSIKPAERAEDAHAPSTTTSADDDDETKNQKLSEVEIDSAVIEALMNPLERKTVAEFEELVIKFIGDTSKDILEFSANLGTYQKMLAHRVAQAYGIQTSTVDYEEGPGRVIGTRTKGTRFRQVRLTKLDVAVAMAEREADRQTTGTVPVGGKGVQMMKRQPGLDFAAHSMSAHVGNSNLSQKEREEDYHRARERIIGVAAEPAAVSPPMATSNASSGNGGHFPSASAPGKAGGGGHSRSGGGSRGGTPFSGSSMAGRGRGRKAVFRDKDRDIHDPDYARRDGPPTAVYDNRGYPANEGYSDYARQQQQQQHQQQQQWNSGGGMPQHYRAGPPPPPPPPNKGHQAVPPSYQPVPAVGGMRPMPRPGSAVAYPAGAGMPGGMPMSQYNMAGYAGAMAYPGGMPAQQQSMYAAAAHGMAFQYGGMPTPGAPQGHYPMYPAPGYMYPQAMTAMQMQAAGRPMEQMYYPAAQYGGGGGGYTIPMSSPGGGGEKQQHQQHQLGRGGQGLHSAGSGSGSLSGEMHQVHPVPPSKARQNQG